MASYGCLMLLTLFTWIVQTWTIHVIPGYENEQACYGTATGFANNGDAKSRYQKYKDTYTNCTYVSGNLEIVFLDEPGVDYDMSFLSQIREVTGYVLIAGNIVDYIPLTSLRIIRGSPLFHHNKTNSDFSLFIALNYENQGEHGLRELRFTSLSEISRGKVFFQNNDKLCFENTIHWKDIIPNKEPPVIFISDNKEPKRQCGQCHESCYNNVTKSRHCWGEGPHMCQKLSYGDVCHGNCAGRCYGSLPNECCHPQCAGGCTGPKKTDCYACIHYQDDGVCVESCPKSQSYDTIQMIKVPNPSIKYAFGSVCVSQCPEFMLQDEEFCVKECNEGKFTKDQRHCEKCYGPCPRKCQGIDPPGFLNLKNIKQFEGCTTIEGNMCILASSFDRDAHYDIEPLQPQNLTVLKNVREITGYLLIQSNTSDVADLSFLSSLEVIHGRHASDNLGYSLNIFSTPLRSLGLTSLKQIRNGNVFIVYNTNLCYADTIDWKSLLSHSEQTVNVRGNMPRAQCDAEGKVCDSECGSHGCWGKGPDKCVKCANYVYEEKSLCLNRCSDYPRLYHGEHEKCMECHKQCANKCTGPNNTDCDQCANVAMRNMQGKISCEESCGDSMYADENRICQPCHANCGQNGCTGPGKHFGQNGCNFCDMGIKESPDGKIECLPPDNQNCSNGYHKGFSRRTKEGRLFELCERCHEYCISCTGPTTQYCTECRYVREEKYCVKECLSFQFANRETKMCEKCDSECRTGCTGPTSADCLACANFKIYTNKENKTFNCTQECPPHLPFHVREFETDENRVVCADSSHPEVTDRNAEEEKRKLTIVLGVSVPLAIILIGMVIIITYFCHKRAQNNMKAAEYTAKIVAGADDIELLTPTNAKPDLAQMRVINEEELRKGAIIGSGAFGTVYKGIWIPHGENVKIPVAIKVLQEGTSPSHSTELLEEARVMCSVDNICCVRILAVCMKSQMMLVTQLMPHGNLLNYVRSNAQHIGSKALLNWCTQIARGMAYLEERGIVHRDLAARNVLVQTPNQVKITDFGLAKLLDSESPEYRSSGGLMPIKWLALECILHRIFTHKSDVWSFGITVWELFTLGKKPYDGVTTKDVPILLEKGERLQQPMICTIDVYMIMVKCWMLDAESRPSFKELQEEFAKMSRDPGRYLVIEGDALMRLPSVSYDKNELIHGISGGGSESVIEAEEYLCPTDRQEQLRPQSFIDDRQLRNGFLVPPAQMANRDFTDRMKRGHEGQKVREKEYGHLAAAVRAKQQRELPHLRGDSVNSRYSSDPIKFLRDREETHWGHSDELDQHLQSQNRRSQKVPTAVILPVDEDDYLQPGAAAQYLNLDGKGYYKNEKEAVSDSDDPFSEEMERMLDQINGHHLPNMHHITSGVSSRNQWPSNSHQGKGNNSVMAVTNPDYFDEETGAWNQKHPFHNGYMPVPNSSMSPVHQNNNQSPQYKIINGAASTTLESSQMLNRNVDCA